MNVEWWVYVFAAFLVLAIVISALIDRTKGGGL